MSKSIGEINAAHFSVIKEASLFLYKILNARKRSLEIKIQIKKSENKERFTWFKFSPFLRSYNKNSQ